MSSIDLVTRDLLDCRCPGSDDRRSGRERDAKAVSSQVAVLIGPGLVIKSRSADRQNHVTLLVELATSWRPPVFAGLNGTDCRSQLRRTSPKFARNRRGGRLCLLLVRVAGRGNGHWPATSRAALLNDVGQFVREQ